MFKEYLVRISTDGIVRDVVIIAINSQMAQQSAVDEHGADFGFVLRELTICETCDQ